MGGFELVGTLGKGGMGRVYLARQERPRREVALKVIHPHLATDDVRARFAREADALGRLGHPNIVAVHTFGQEGDQLFMAMERVQGRSLKGVIDGADGPLDIDRAQALAGQIASGLAHAHARQVIHRDLKPSNILVTAVDGVETVKLVDFGLARFLDGDVTVTQSGRLVGSAPYMSPEQWDERRDLDGAVDVYAFGIVVFQMLTGRLPFEATTPAGLMRAHLTLEPMDPVAARPELAQHPDLVRLVRRCLQRRREDRPTAGELRDELVGSAPDLALVAANPATDGGRWSEAQLATDDAPVPWGGDAQLETADAVAPWVDDAEPVATPAPLLAESSAAGPVRSRGLAIVAALVLLGGGAVAAVSFSGTSAGTDAPPGVDGRAVAMLVPAPAPPQLAAPAEAPPVSMPKTSPAAAPKPPVATPQPPDDARNEPAAALPAKASQPTRKRRKTARGEASKPTDKRGPPATRSQPEPKPTKPAKPKLNLDDLPIE